MDWLTTKIKALVVVAKLLLAPQLGLGTVFFSAGDRWNPDPHLACMHRDLRDTDLVVAHPTLPCRSLVWLYNPRTGLDVVATVGDRGPKHAMVDMSRGVARRLGHNGHERVLMVPLGGP